jgi:hypothetical protein
MEKLISADEAVRSHCLSSLQFWINSIVVHTFDRDRKRIAPILFVGTRKDKVGDTESHRRISESLCVHFCSSLAWPYVIPNQTDGLWFYPVDNTEGRSDASAIALLEDIETIIDESPYVQIERPLSYFKFLDNCNAHKGGPLLTLEQAIEMAVTSGVKKDDVIPMLKILHEIGVLMFLGTVLKYTCPIYMTAYC